MFFSKRAFNAPSSSSRCFGDKSLLLPLMFCIRVALVVVASRVSYLLLRLRSATWVFFRACLCVLIHITANSAMVLTFVVLPYFAKKLCSPTQGIESD